MNSGQPAFCVRGQRSEPMSWPMIPGLIYLVGASVSVRGFKCSGKCYNQSDFGFLRRRSQVKRIYPISTLSRLPPILPNWMGSSLGPLADAERRPGHARSGLDTSAAEQPIARISAAALLMSLASREHTNTRAPSSAKDFAQALPSPLLAPAMNALQSFKPRSLLESQYAACRHS